ncbi:MAG TPA: 16S rRNA (cytosine(1402)-N(4))-methyltransferase RsmH [Anaerolineae bacterium]|nr:16S rRNA (cytosine(1402)-N(4))-methyltransferase RsmH [Anaerolineae bacterium]
MDIEPSHTPVLYQEVLAGLQVRPGGRYIDGTVGAGGHAQGILDASTPDGRLLGIDADPAAIELSREKLVAYGGRVTLVHGNFAELEAIARREGFFPADGILLDLGLSSMQLEAAPRGFSFLSDGPLDMRFDPTGPTTAADLVNGLSVEELAEILYRYGEEPRARAIARAIVARRPLHTTRELAAVVEQVVRRRGRIHPATRTFQALRIAVNGELDALEAVLPQAVRVLAPGGVLAVIAFHSLEDRLVKRFFQRESRDCLCPPEQPICTCGHRATLEILTPKPIRPRAEEVQANPRSRSARLRLARRLGDECMYM